MELQHVTMHRNLILGLRKVFVFDDDCSFCSFIIVIVISSIVLLYYVMNYYKDPTLGSKFWGPWKRRLRQRDEQLEYEENAAAKQRMDLPAKLHHVFQWAVFPFSKSWVP